MHAMGTLAARSACGRMRPAQIPRVGRAVPWPRTCWTRLLLGCDATNHSDGASKRHIRILRGAGLELEEIFPLNVQKASRRRRERVLEGAACGETNGTAAAVGGVVVLKERLMEQVHVAAVDLRGSRQKAISLVRVCVGGGVGGVGGGGGVVAGYSGGASPAARRRSRLQRSE